jgi:hypothetical protein
MRSGGSTSARAVSAILALTGVLRLGAACADFNALDHCYGHACGVANTAPTDAAIDGATSPLDAGGSDRSPPPPTTWCGDHTDALFCADFDEGAFDAGWTAAAANGGALGPSVDRYKSPPQALLVTTPAFDGSPLPTATLTHDLPADVSLRVQWDTFIDLSGDVDNIDYGGIGLRDGLPYAVRLRMRRTSSAQNDWLFEYGQSPDAGSTVRVLHNLLQHAATANWMHVEIQLDVTKPSLKVLLDDIEVGTFALTVPMQGRRPFITMGVPSVAGTGAAAKVYVDNVLVQAL